MLAMEIVVIPVVPRPWIELSFSLLGHFSALCLLTHYILIFLLPRYLVSQTCSASLLDLVALMLMRCSLYRDLTSL